MVSVTTRTILVCGWCETVLEPEPCAGELASLHVDLLRHGAPLVRRTICPLCLARYEAAVADAEAA